MRILHRSLPLLAVALATACSSHDSNPDEPPLLSPSIDRFSIEAVGKVDLVFMVDNSPSMADKQKVLARTVPDLVNRLVNPDCVALDAQGQVIESTRASATDGACPAGTQREFRSIKDIHIAVLTSSLGGHGSDSCVEGSPGPHDETQNDFGRPISRRLGGGAVDTYQGAGFLAWDPDPADPANDPPGESNLTTLLTNFSALVEGADQKGCGFESSLEAWYRFLIDPDPPASVTARPGEVGATSSPVVAGTDELLLQQRAAFLRPDSLVAVVSLSDENDCSILDGVMPPDVCDTPTLDASGKPTGCNGARLPWPASYGRGNFQDFTVTDGRVTGTPFPVNQVAAQLEVPGSTSNCAPGADGTDPGQTFCVPPGTAACETEPDSAACKSCLLLSPAEQAAQGCTPQVAASDPPSLRCWDQKRRFGVDMLYPLQRYIDGLQNPTVYDRDGYLVQNPLFDDLPFKAARAAGKPLARAKASPRNSQLVFFTAITGVPWQDIARDKTNLELGYRPAVATEADPTPIDWDLILGNPLGYNGEARRDPTDPLMIESNVGDRREGKKHPITGETISATSWNRINGRELSGQPGSLRLACVFDLVPDVGGEFEGCNGVLPTEGAEGLGSPLCERPVSPTDSAGSGAFDDPPRQYRAGATPGTRFLQVARSFGANAVVASICAPNLKDEGRRDFGYRPAIGALVDRLKTQFHGLCLPRAVPMSGGVASCTVLDARFPVGDADPAALAGDPAVAACQRCEGPGRRPVDPGVLASLASAGLRPQDFACVCEVPQLEGDDLARCQGDPGLEQASSGGGWCYVDPAAPGADQEAASEIVKACPATRKRTLRFVNAAAASTTLLVACAREPVAAGGGRQAP